MKRFLLRHLDRGSPVEGQFLLRSETRPKRRSRFTSKLPASGLSTDARKLRSAGHIVPPPKYRSRRDFSGNDGYPVQPINRIPDQDGRQRQQFHVVFPSTELHLERSLR
jgi:hypothetical protein